VLPAYQVCYGLPVADFERSLAACIGGKQNRVSLDNGALTACRIDGRVDHTRLKVSKIVQFESPIDNVAAYVVYRLAEDEFVDSTAELACCE
jgi:translation initiation factor IF-1